MTKLETLWLRYGRGNLTAILLVTAVFCAFVLFSINGATLPRNTGFGPEWDCTIMAKGDPVCIKKHPADPNLAKSK